MDFCNALNINLNLESIHIFNCTMFNVCLIKEEFQFQAQDKEEEVDGLVDLKVSF